MSFTTPLALLLLLALPYIFWLGRPRQRYSLRGRWRDWASVGLRVLILLLLVLALSGAQAVRAADELSVVFLVDASDSITPTQAEAAEAYIRTAIEEMGPDDRAAVILFGGNALVERPMSGLAELPPITSVPQALNTDLAEAVQLALAIFPAGSGRRIVILSDGAATLGDSLEAAQLAATTGVQIDYVPLLRPAGDTEVLVTNVDAPTRVRLGESFTVRVTVESNDNMAATLRISAGGAVVHETPVDLTVGQNNYSVRLQADEQEFTRYQVEIVPAQDTYYQNNQMAAFTEIVGAPRVLVVSPDGTLDDNGNPVPDESPQLILALEATGIAVDRTTPQAFPVSLAQVSNYASIILVNVNAADLTPRKMETLQIYVRDLGGGLVAVGGPESFGMGGYFRTALEEALPVNMQIQDQERFPSVTMVIVIDRSGSMGQQEGALTKIQLAAEGAVRVVELLNDFDVISVIPVDTQPSGMIGPASAAERETLIGEIRQIGAGGGGIYVRTGLEEAAQVLAESGTEVNHIILLADGSDSEQKEGVPELIDNLVAQDVTITTVSIGEGPDTPWLSDMATRGNGRFHLTDRASNLPEIFTQETTAIQRSYLVEERFFPTLVQQSPILAGIREVPPLQGYVGTEAKATARVVLETHLGDPLLATWQYGLGRAVAWTSDATGRWGSQWVTWEGFPIFWAQTVRWTMTENRDSNVETVIDYEGEIATLTVDTRASSGDFLNDLTMEANLVDPDGRTETVVLEQIAPGRYQTSFAPDEAGAYFVRVSGHAEGEEEAVVAQTSGWVLGYSPEYRQFESNEAELVAMAAATGGRDVSGDPLLVFEHSLEAERIRRPIWPWLLLAAVVLLPLDIAMRRLVITRRDWQRAWAATFGRWQRTPVEVVERTEQVSRLFEAKQRARTSGQQNREEVLAQQVALQEQAQVEHRQAAPQDQPDPRPVARPEGKREVPAGDSGGALASRLLAKRRQREDNQKNSK